MKAIINSLKRTHWLKASVAFITCLVFLTFPSCQKDELNQELLDMEGMVFTATEISSSADLYYGPEVFKVASKAPVVETRTSLNPNFDEFDGNFILKVQNGNTPLTKVKIIEIRMDGVLIVSSSDFRKTNTVSKSLSGLTSASTLDIKLIGPKGSFITLWIEGFRKELVAYYPFNGNANDESGYKNHGTLYGPVSSPDRFGNVNSAYLFDGEDDFIKIEESPSLMLSTGLSVCAWVKCFKESEIERIVSKWGYGDHYNCSFNISFLNGSSLFEVSPDNIPTQVNSGPVTTDVWYFLIGTFDGSNIRLYVNGELKGTNSFTSTLCQGLPLFIGCENGTWLPFNGIIDDVRIYKRALSEAEILKLFHEGG
jgi:hypothetical protein